MQGTSFRKPECWGRDRATSARIRPSRAGWVFVFEALLRTWVWVSSRALVLVGSTTKYKYTSPVRAFRWRETRGVVRALVMAR